MPPATPAQARHFAGFVEYHFDIDGAGLLLHLQHIGRDALHMAGEMLAGEGIQGDARRQAKLELGRIDLVDRGGDIEATVVDQVDGGRCGDAGR